MAKTWENMTPDEKLEDLRSDIKRTMDAVNGLNQRLSDLGMGVNRSLNLATEVSKAVEALEKKVGK